MDTVAAPPQESEPFVLPPRPRRQLGGRAVLALVAVLLVAVGFLAGVKVEKSQVNGTSSTGTGRADGGAAGFAALRARLAAGGGAGTAAGGGGAGGIGGSFGTVSSISGNTLYLTEISGNTVKVALTSATTITKSVNAHKSALRPGDSLAVRGLTRAGGEIVASTVSDTGARSTGSSASSGGGSTGGAGGAVNSLFGSSGGG